MSEEPRIICPYNKSHYILAKRFATHLVKCRKDNPSPLLQCHFDVNHRIAQPELQYHHTVCSSRADIEAVIYQEEGEDVTEFPFHNINVVQEENWDDENVTSYNPQQYCETQDVLRHTDVVPPSVRKGFKYSERERLSSLNWKEDKLNKNIKKSKSKSGPSTSEPATSGPKKSPSIQAKERTAELLKNLSLTDH